MSEQGIGMGGHQHTSDGVKTSPMPCSVPTENGQKALDLCKTVYDLLMAMNDAAVRLAAEGKPDAARLMLTHFPDEVMVPLFELGRVGVNHA